MTSDSIDDTIVDIFLIHNMNRVIETFADNIEEINQFLYDNKIQAKTTPLYWIGKSLKVRYEFECNDEFISLLKMRFNFIEIKV